MNEPVKKRQLSAVIQRYLGRITGNRVYVPQIDGLRCLAILGVILVHTGGGWYQKQQSLHGNSFEKISWLPIVYLGRYGVELFFVISGFILAFPFAAASTGERGPVKIKSYYVRRLTRIEPPYVISLFIFFIASVAIGKYGVRELMPHLYASLAYMHNVIYGTGSLINNVAWSLEVEVQFYLLFPLFAGVLRIRESFRYIVYFLTTLLFILCRLWLCADWPQTLLAFGHYFVAGIFLCDLYVNRLRVLPLSRLWDLLLIPGAVVFLLAHLEMNQASIEFANLTAFACVFLAALLGSFSSRIFSWGVIPVVGGMCYSIYLIHGRVISLFLTAFPNGLVQTGSLSVDMLLIFVVLVPMCVLCSTVFYVLAERPFMVADWPQKSWKALRSLWG